MIGSAAARAEFKSRPVASPVRRSAGAAALIADLYARAAGAAAVGTGAGCMM